MTHPAVERLRAVVANELEPLPEINTSNYNHEDACKLNAWACQADTEIVTLRNSISALLDVVEVANRCLLKARGRSGGAVYMIPREDFLAMKSALSALAAKVEKQG